MMDLLVLVGGLVIGSFLNVCIYRLPLNKNVLWGRSQCPHCGHYIPWYLNIPVLSFVVLRGRCKFCKAKISFQYPIVEILSAVVTYALYRKFGFTAHFIFYLIFVYTLIVIGVIDLKSKLILNKLLIFLIIFAIIFNGFFKVVEFKPSAIGALLGGGVLWLVAWLGEKIFQKEALGMGDVKLAFVSGFFLGYKQILLALYLGFVLALIGIFVFWLFRRKNVPQLIPMGPFFALGFLIYLLYGQQLIYWYLTLFS